MLDVIRLYDDDEKEHCVSISLTNTLNIINFADGLSQIDRIRFIIDDDVDDYFYSSFLQVHMNFAVYFKILVFHFFLGSSLQGAHKIIGTKWHWIHMGGDCW